MFYYNIYFFLFFGGMKNAKCFANIISCWKNQNENEQNKTEFKLDLPVN